MHKLPDFIAPEVILNNTSDGIYVTDTGCRILYWNRAAERITGWLAEDVVNKLCSEGILMHVDRMGNRLCVPGRCPLHRCMAAKLFSSEPLTVFAHHKQGHRVPVAVSVAPIQDESGMVIGGVEVFRDISSRMRDLERARLVQQHSMNPELPKGRVSFEARCFPHDMVGGDYYQVGTLKDGRHAFFLGDVMGHGVSAALYTMTLHALWQENTASLAEPAKFLSHLNHELFGQTLEDSFITGFMGLIDPSTGRLDYASAGHPPPFLLDPEARVQKLDSLDLPLAMVPDIDFSQASASLKPGGKLLLYSDAALEATNPAGDQFGCERFADLVLAAHKARSKDFLGMIRQSLLEFVESVELEDDLALLLVSLNE